jgi:hypothetical protein
VAKKARLGNPVAVRRLRTGGYPKKTPAGWVLQDGHGNVIAFGHQINCTKIRPGSRGSWIDSQRCSYRFKFVDVGKKGAWYSCRGYGEGIAVSCRRMKSAPRRDR